MTKPSNTRYKVAQRELSLPEIANELSNVSRARDMIGYSRQQCYGIRWNFQAYGADGLIDRLPGLKDIHPNCVAAETETAILEHAFAQGARICVLIDCAKYGLDHAVNIGKEEEGQSKITFT